MHLLKISVCLLLLVTRVTPSWAIEPEALSPNEILSRIEKAQATIETLPTSNQPRWVLWAAVSFSMPQKSLLRLAGDAADAQIPLVFRGVGTEPNDKNIDRKGKPETALQRYGKGFLARHLADFEPLIQTGATVKLDPKRFEKASVTDVPRVILMRENLTASGNSFYFTARGDVTLRYALQFLVEEIENTPGLKLSKRDREEALEVLQSALTQLGDRP